MSGQISGAEGIPLPYLIICMGIMAGTTYLIRVIPMAVFRKKITNRFLRSFLSYMPYAVLSAMTFPAILYCTGSVPSAAAGCGAAVILAYLDKGLLTVAVGAAVTVLLASGIGF